MSQLRDGSFGRFANQDGGMPVKRRTVCTPLDVPEDEGVGGGAAPLEEVLIRRGLVQVCEEY